MTFCGSGFLELQSLVLGSVGAGSGEGLQEAQPPKHPVSECQDTRRRNTGIFGANLG